MTSVPPPPPPTTTTTTTTTTTKRSNSNNSIDESHHNHHHSIANRYTQVSCDPNLDSSFHGKLDTAKLVTPQKEEEQQQKREKRTSPRLPSSTNFFQQLSKVERLKFSRGGMTTTTIIQKNKACSNDESASTTIIATDDTADAVSSPVSLSQRQRTTGRRSMLFSIPNHRTGTCDLCNTEGDHLLECSHDTNATTATTSGTRGCGKLVHTYCVGREELPPGDWICTGCANEDGIEVQFPKDLTSTNFPDYGHEFPSNTVTETEKDQEESSLVLCDICNVGGDLITCWSPTTAPIQGCRKVFHSYCLKREDPPTGDWLCSSCCSDKNGFPPLLDKKLSTTGYDVPYTTTTSSTSSSINRRRLHQTCHVPGDKAFLDNYELSESLQMTHESSSSDDDEEDAVCGECNIGGDLITCFSSLGRGRGCGSSFHMYCVRREDNPSGDWICSCCAKCYGLPLDKDFPIVGCEVTQECEELLNRMDDDILSDDGDMSDSSGDNSSGDDDGKESKAWKRVRVGSRVEIYWEGDDVYYSAIVEKRGPLGHFHLKYEEDDEQEVLDLRKERIRLVAVQARRGQNARGSDIDPSEGKFIICGSGMTQANLQKHGYLTYRHYIDTMFYNYSNAAAVRDRERMCRKVLTLLNEEGIQFIYWDPDMKGFARQSHESSMVKIRKAFRRKRKGKWRAIENEITSVDANEPIQHVLLLNTSKEASASNSKPKTGVGAAAETPVPFCGGVGQKVILNQQTAESANRQHFDLDCVHAFDEHPRVSDRATTQHGLDALYNEDIPGLSSSKSKRWELHTGFYLLSPRPSKKPKYSKQQDLINELLSQIRTRPRSDGPRLAASKTIVNKLTDQAQNPSGEKEKYPPSTDINKVDGSSTLMAKKPASSAKKMSPATLVSPKEKLADPPQSSPNSTLALASRTGEKNENGECPTVPVYSGFQQLRWKQLLASLKVFREEHGHCEVPSSYSPDPYLAIWAKCQRDQYQFFLQNSKRTTLSKERIDALNNVGFSWGH